MKSSAFFAFVGALLFFASSVSSHAKTEEEVNNYLQQTTVPDFTVENMPGLDALNLVQKLGNLNQYGIFFEVAAREKVKKASITLGLKNAPLYDILQMIAAQCNVQMKIRRDQVLLFEPGGQTPGQE